ncbi:NAD(P)/FAD-dependent oxidoreductase [Bordetella genomosp. 9]|uniref:Oxidoreductase n=1 Tax=Bordetella genomosp. 9 TaxID=1416803 RepID=A0A1W6Z4N0_9BORD|nr:NAD(P)/FAD-dependent oxidoreductase [Bordetella genomosp. 9]ARP88114.1 oxidoreductase [Bordetella genomosp. 9]ARP92850.1 oxidoreductase [Bordetella genomosp. 9]
MREDSDAIIVGGGPAGASCAIWLARLGLSPLLVDAAARLGGLENDNPFRDDWIAVLPGVTGQQVAANIAQSVAAARVPALTGHRALRVARRDRGFDVSLLTPYGTPARVHGRFLVIASGVRARNLPGAEPGQTWPGVLVGPGVAVHEQDYRGLSVAVLGGGDNGFENYAFVRGRGAREVHLYSRTVRARPQLVAAADTRDLHVGAYAVDPVARSVNGRRYDLILVFYGWEPQAAFADSLQLARDARGYIMTDSRTALTSAAGVYAIGEVANRMHPCVVTSMADGVVAAKAIQAEIERRG